MTVTVHPIRAAAWLGGMMLAFALMPDSFSPHEAAAYGMIATLVVTALSSIDLTEDERDNRAG